MIRVLLLHGLLAGLAGGFFIRTFKQEVLMNITNYLSVDSSAGDWAPSSYQWFVEPALDVRGAPLASFHENTLAILPFQMCLRTRYTFWALDKQTGRASENNITLSSR
jgi:hypothetical protein